MHGPYWGQVGVLAIFLTTNLVVHFMVVVVGVDGVMMDTIFSFWGQYYVRLSRQLWLTAQVLLLVVSSWPSRKRVSTSCHVCS
jgi:hypothetical protein